jgi:hypothetical protein
MLDTSSTNEGTHVPTSHKRPAGEKPVGGERLFHSPSGIKVMQTWRLPKDLVDFLRVESAAHNYEVTPFATKILNAYRSYFEVDARWAAQLEEDRLKLRMSFFEYIRHVLSGRAEEVKEQGPGFDDPGRRVSATPSRPTK